MVMIELKDICKSFGDHVVLKNFSLKINKMNILMRQSRLSSLD